ncbi:MAG: S41 family peptidase [Rhodospirillaceae bacterium]
MRPGLRWSVIALVLAAAGCGGGGGSGGGISGSGGNSGGSLGGSWTQGVFQPSTTYANQCASPRTGIDPATGRRYPDVQGSTLTENNFLRSWTNELYLWYNEVQDQNPASYSTPTYFNLLKTMAVTPSGKLKDRFHFTYPTAEWQALSQSGVEAGYGAQFLVIASTPPREVVVAYTEPGSPATTPPVNLARGARVLTVDGVDLVNATDSTSVGKLNEGLFPSSAGATHTFSVLDAGASAPRAITMVSANVTSTPVQNVGTVRVASGTVGYLLFNDHIATAEQGLVNAFRQLSDAKVNDLVLDIRYNGGGYLDIASEVAYMIAGPGTTAGKTFEKTVFSDKHPTKDPVTGETIVPVPFYSTAQGLSVPEGQALPTLNLQRVIVLTGANTCSASESIINGLLGVGVEVVQVGATTCGKPYGFYPEDNCGTTYFSIQFKGANEKGFGDYPDGFSPANATGAVGVPVSGCAVADDFGHALGDPQEARMEAALGYLSGGACPAPSAIPSAVEAGQAWTVGEGTLHRSPWRENRILRR